MTTYKPLPPLEDLQDHFRYNPYTGELKNWYTGTIQTCLDSDGKYIVVNYLDQNWQSHRFCYYLGTEKDPNAHFAPFTGYPEKEKTILAGKTKGQSNPNFNPDSTLLQTYNSPARTAHSLGHVQFKPKEDGGFTLTDTYDVDSNVSMGAKPYKPLRGTRTDLQEGGQLASRLYDLSKFIGVNQPMKYNVEFDAQRFK